MDLEDKADEGSKIRLVRDAQYSTYRLASTDLTPADELTGEDSFPQYGDFALCYLPDGSGDAAPQVYVEVPQDLAAKLVEAGIGEGDRFRVEGAQKVDGEWQVTVDTDPDPQKS